MVNKDDSIVIHLDSRINCRYLESDLNGNPLSTNFSYDLVEAIEIPNNEIVEISLYTATIPYSFYNVRQNINNSFIIRYYSNLSNIFEEQATIFLDEGNYSATGLLNAFKTKITNLSDDANYIHPEGQQLIKTLNFTTNYSRETLKFNIICTTSLPNGNIFGALELEFVNTKSLFGVRKNILPYKFTNDDQNRVFNSEICIDINDNIHGLYIRQNLTSKSTLDNESGTFSNILARIPINTNAGGIIFHTPSNSTHRARTSLHSIQTINIKLTDDANNTIDLNGLHFQISLLLTFLGKKDNQKMIERTRTEILNRNLETLKQQKKNTDEYKKKILLKHSILKENKKLKSKKKSKIK